MKMILTVKSFDKAQGARDRAIIVRTFDKYARTHGMDAVESRLSVMCLEIAEKLGYVFEQTEDELIFLQRGIN